MSLHPPQPLQMRYCSITDNHLKNREVDHVLFHGYLWSLLFFTCFFFLGVHSFWLLSIKHSQITLFSLQQMLLLFEMWVLKVGVSVRKTGWEEDAYERLFCAPVGRVIWLPFFPEILVSSSNIQIHTPNLCSQSAAVKRFTRFSGEKGKWVSRFNIYSLGTFIGGSYHGL